MATDSHNALRPPSPAAVLSGMAPEKWRRHITLTARLVNPKLIRKAVPTLFISSHPF